MALQSDLPIIDAHVHLRGPGSAENLLGMLDGAALVAINLLSAAALGAENVGQNAAVLWYKAAYPGRFYAFGGLRHPQPDGAEDVADFAEQARRLVEAGCDGIKMIEGKPTVRKALGVPLDDPSYDGFYAYMESARLPILYHVADPETFWDAEHATEDLRRRGWYYGDGTFPPKEQLYDEIGRVLEKHPGLPVIFAHFFFLSADPERAARFLDRWPAVSFDITPGSEMYYNFSRDPATWRDFYTRYRDRIVLGTDNSGGRRPDPEKAKGGVEKIRTIRQFLETDGEPELWGKPLKGLGLGRQVVGRIYAGNFRRYAGPEPKALVPALAVAECERALAAARAIDAPPEASEQLERMARDLRDA